MMQIADLRDVPEHCGAVADRVWNAWWRSKGTPLEYIRGRVDENLRSTGIPFAVVAHLGGRFVGTASVIESDLVERPDLSPWVAAVWVDKEHRHTGIGTALVKAAIKGAFAVTNGPVYLCAKRTLAPFYESMGWQRIAEDVGGLDVYRHLENQPGVG